MSNQVEAQNPLKRSSVEAPKLSLLMLMKKLKKEILDEGGTGVLIGVRTSLLLHVTPIIQ